MSYNRMNSVKEYSSILPKTQMVLFFKILNNPEQFLFLDERVRARLAQTETSTIFHKFNLTDSRYTYVRLVLQETQLRCCLESSIGE